MDLFPYQETLTINYITNIIIIITFQWFHQNYNPRRKITSDDKYNDENNKKTVNINAFYTWMIQKCATITIVTKTKRLLPVVQENMDVITLVADGHDVWRDGTNPILNSFVFFISCINLHSPPMPNLLNGV